MTARVSPAALAHFEQVLAYHADPANAPHRHPPPSPNPEIALEIGACLAGLIAVMLDCSRIENPCEDDVRGILADGPSIWARLRTAELIDRQLSQGCPQWIKPDP